MNMLPLLKKCWHDPVWSKVIAGAILALLGGVLTYRHFQPESAPSMKPTPPVSLTLENSGADSIAIQRRGDFVLWFPQGVDGVRRLPGRYDIDVVEGQTSQLVVVVSPKAAVNVVAQLHAEIPLRQVLDGGAADLEFIFKKELGGVLFSGSIPFAENRITTTRWRIDLAKKE
jgi:hypothetical protein